MLAWIFTVLALISFVGSTVFVVWNYRRVRRAQAAMRKYILDGLIKRDVQ